MSAVCAAEGCTNPIDRRPRRGRPAIYCSPSCRPSHTRRTITVELVHPTETIDGRSAERVWTVLLRRGPRTVVLAEGVGWASATALSEELRWLLEPMPRHRGTPLD